MNTPARDALIDTLLGRTAVPVAADGHPFDARLANAITVHRQTVRHALLEALRAAFPAVGVAVGADYFDALAAEFIARHPPRSPVLQTYGATFATFVSGFPPLHDWPWLADLARVDWARREAYHAADATPIAPSSLSSFTPASLSSARFTLHPSLRLLDSIHPVFSLWHAHQADDVLDRTAADATAGDTSIHWEAEACQVWRIDERVHVKPVPASTFAFLLALSEGRPLQSALWSAFDGDSDRIDADAITSLLRPLVEDRLIVAVLPSDT